MYNLKKFLGIFLLVFLCTICSTEQSNVASSETETTTTQNTTTTTTTTVKQNNINLSITSNSLTGSINQSVNIKLTADGWKGSVGSSQVYLKAEPYKAMYNWIGGMSGFTTGLDNLIQADRNSGLIGTKRYSINISSGIWSGAINGKNFKIKLQNGTFEGYGPKEVVLLIIIYSN